MWNMATVLTYEQTVEQTDRIVNAIHSHGSMLMFVICFCTVALALVIVIVRKKQAG